jgi:flagellar motility protein MotE (MotC chaperone)
MKVLLAFVLMTLGTLVFSSEEKKVEVSNTKVYTEDEFQKKLTDELSKLLKKIHKDDLTGFAKELMERESDLKAIELAQEASVQQMKISQKEFEKKMQEFQEKQKTFLSCLDSTDQKENKRVDHLVAIISGMKPQNAADVLSVQEAEIAVQVLGMLEPAKVSKIFNLMEKITLRKKCVIGKMKVQPSLNLLSTQSTKSNSEGSSDLMQLLLGKTAAVEGQKDLTSFLPGQNLQMDNALFMQEFNQAIEQSASDEQNLTVDQLMAQAKAQVGLKSQDTNSQIDSTLVQNSRPKNAAVENVENPNTKVIKTDIQKDIANLLKTSNHGNNNLTEDSPDSNLSELSKLIKTSKVDSSSNVEKFGQAKAATAQLELEGMTTGLESKDQSNESKLNKIFNSGVIPVKNDLSEVSFKDNLKDNKKLEANPNFQNIDFFERSRGLKAYGESAPLNAGLIVRKHNTSSLSKEDKVKSQNFENLSDSILNANNSNNANVDLTKVVTASRPLAQVNMSNMPSTTPVFDMSKMNNSQAEQIIQQVTQYLQQSQIRNGKELNLTVNHESLGQFKINARKMKDGDGINLEINTMGDAAHKFFTKHENDLMSKLSLSGVKITDYKVSNSTQQQSTSFDMNQQDHSKSGQSFGQAQADMMNSKNGEQRRKDLWQYYQAYKEGMAA